MTVAGDSHGGHYGGRAAHSVQRYLDHGGLEIPGRWLGGVVPSPAVSHPCGRGGQLGRDSVQYSQKSYRMMALRLGGVEGRRIDGPHRGDWWRLVIGK